MNPEDVEQSSESAASELVKWQGADRGREGFLLGPRWLKVLQILSQHEGDSIRDGDAPMYDDLMSEFPDETWYSPTDERSFFRDYAASWTNFGALVPTAETGGTIVLTERGRQVASEKISLTDFIRDAIDEYAEEWIVGSRRIRVSPFELISLSLSNTTRIDVASLRNRTEEVADQIYGQHPSLRFDSGDTPTRRFRSYVSILKSAGAIEQDGRELVVLDDGYLSALVSIDTAAKSAIQHADASADIDDLLTDHRIRQQFEQPVRHGQQRFKDSLLEAYGASCCVSGCTTEAVLHAAHILPYLGRQSNSVTNGLLLAADIHALFDANLIGIDPSSMSVTVSTELVDARYAHLEATGIHLPGRADCHPDRRALKIRYDEFLRAESER